MLGLGLSLQKGVSAFNAGRALVSSYIRRVTSDGGVLQNTACDVAAINELNQDRLLEPASWVLVPDGIKEDVVYAQKPSTGLGDLTFTRASDATYTDSTGVVRRSPYNLVTQSVWTGGGVNVAPTGWSQADTTGNFEPQTAINGSVPYRFYATNGRRSLRQVLNFNTGQEIRLSVFVNSVTITSSISGVIGLSVLTTANVKYYVNNVEVDGSTNITANTRIAISLTFTSSGAATIRIGGGSFGASTYDYVISQPQLVEGTSALDYFPTTDRLNVPRIDFRNADGTLSTCGRLLLEPQRTNGIRNSSIVGAVAGSPGTLPTNWDNVLNGLTRTVVGFGTENGLPYVDVRLSGTATGTTADIRPEAFNIIAATTGQTWSSSSYFKLIAAPAAPNAYQVLIFERTSAGPTVATGTQNFTPTSTLQRFTFTRTLTGGATVAFVQSVVNFTLTIGQTYDFTIRIAAPQMELGAFATTWVPTTTAAVTRIVDAFIRDDLQTNGILSNTGLTWYTKFRKRIGSGADAFPRLQDATENNVIGFSTTANTLQSSVRIAGGSYVNTNIISNYNNEFVRACFTLNETTLKVFVNGSLVLTTTAATSSTYTRLRTAALIEKDLAIDESLIIRTPLSDNECEVLTSEGYGNYALLAQSLNCVLQ